MKKVTFTVKKVIILIIINLILIPVLYTEVLTNSFSFDSERAQPLSRVESLLNIESVQCKGVTKKGSRCKRKTNNSNGYCWQHQDQAPKE